MRRINFSPGKLFYPNQIILLHQKLLMIFFFVSNCLYCAFFVFFVFIINENGFVIMKFNAQKPLSRYNVQQTHAKR